MIWGDGKVYTLGNSFRARAEARQRQYRAEVLQVECAALGHLLDARAAAKGVNFLNEEVHAVAKIRRKAGKGVAPRTFDNMLSSQAMCFNLFAPLANRPELAADVLRPFFPALSNVEEIDIEHTPPKAIFADQSGRGGVDCDVLIRGRDSVGDRIVIVIETKFVEPEFSGCGFRKPGRTRSGKPICPEEVSLRVGRDHCLYVRNKHYRYWEQSDACAVLHDDAVPEIGCPFGGDYWQLWVNHVLSHAEAALVGAKSAVFAVCAPRQNHALLQGGRVLDSFRALLRKPETAVFVDIDDLLAVVREQVPDELSDWADHAAKRYGAI